MPPPLNIFRRTLVRAGRVRNAIRVAATKKRSRSKGTRRAASYLDILRARYRRG